MLSRLFQIQTGEGRTVGLIASAMAISVAGVTIGESGISALFFERVGPDELPVMYMAQGAVGIIAMLVFSAVLGRFERGRAYVALPVLLAALLSVERVGLAADAPGIYQAMWLTMAVGYLVQGVCLWGSAGIVTDTRRAKRLFPLFGAGSIFGAIAGGLATRPLASAIGADNLILVWAFCLVATAAMCAAALGLRGRRRRSTVRSRRPSPIAELGRSYAFVRRSSLLLTMSVSAILLSVLFFSLYLPFAQAATVRYPVADDLAGFFGVFWAATTAGAFAVAMLLTNRLLGRFGAAAMLLILGALYAAGFGLLLVVSTFAALVAIRFFVNVWLQGVSSPAWETLVNVVPEHRRDQTRAFLNGGPAQVGTAIAGVVQLVGQEALTPSQLSMIGLVAAGLAIVVAWRVRSSYTSALVAAIRSGRPRVFHDALPNVPVTIRPDAQAMRLAITALEDADPRIRRLAGELIEGAGDERAAGALRSSLSDEDAPVRARAVQALGATGGLTAEEFGRALADDDARVRLAAVWSSRSDDVPVSLLTDADPSVASAAAVRLLAGPSRDEAQSRLEQLLKDEDLGARLTVVDQLGAAGQQDVAALATAALDDSSPAVQARAVEVLSQTPPELAIHAALRGLVSPHEAVRRAAMGALSRLDPRGFEEELSSIVDEWSSRALIDGATAASVTDEGEATDLLRDALMARARSQAVVALSAASVTSTDPDAMRVAVGTLQGEDAGQRANALETLEVAAASTPSARPLLSLWEPSSTRVGSISDLTWLETASDDHDPLIRASAELVRSRRRQGGAMPRSQGSMTPVELVIVLRRIPLFSGLEPGELHSVAAIAEERAYTDGDVIGAEGERGDEMHVLLEGDVRVVLGDGGTIARRHAGDIVGEMAVITRAPRVASLIAEGDVRTLRIGKQEFEGMIRERPSIALAVMRVLAERLGTLTRRPADH